MTARFEVVQTDAGWHARSIADNGEPVLFTEVYTERRTAREALRITAQLFSVTPAVFDVVDGVTYLSAGGMRVEVRDVDETCGCFECIGNKPAPGAPSGLSIGMTRMIVCAACGNKRCPHGTNHRNDCTKSNEPGQSGSRYGGM